jgi:hypothetical protein
VSQNGKKVAILGTYTVFLKEYVHQTERAGPKEKTIYTGSAGPQFLRAEIIMPIMQLAHLSKRRMVGGLNFQPTRPTVWVGMGRRKFGGSSGSTGLTHTQPNPTQPMGYNPWVATLATTREKCFANNLRSES